MRSISSKLILAFLGIGTVSVIIILLTARWNTRTEFIRFLSEQDQTDIVADLSNYYIIHGSWDGVASAVDPDPRGFTPGHDRGPRHQLSLIADQNGKAVTEAGRYKTGDVLSPTDLKSAVPILANNDVIGYYFPIRQPFEGKPRELEFIESVNRTLVYGALIGSVMSLLLGIFLSRTITRPLRELTQATHAVSEGDFSKQVTVRSDDELGELAKAFNTMREELSRSVNARKQMTADIAHELRTPLSLILGHAEAVHDGVLQPTHENFEIIREEAARLEHLVNDLRVLSLADAGELRIQVQPMELERLIREVASSYQLEAQRKNISINVGMTEHLPLVEIDPVRMTQVFTNILDNALRHTPETGQVTISAKQSGDHVEITIADSGPGVQADALERIFERFYRADSSRQRGEGGSGLGLAIARSIVQAHGGQLSAESETGKGLKVILRLPRIS